MHIEKNICDNVVDTPLCIDGKTKDTDKARMDLQDMKIPFIVWGHVILHAAFFIRVCP